MTDATNVEPMQMTTERPKTEPQDRGVIRGTDRTVQRLAKALGLAVALSVLPVVSATAHPHVFIDTTVRIIFDEQSRFTGVSETWTLDYDYTDIIELQLDADQNGRIDDAEFAAAIPGELGWIPENDYFTRVTIGGREIETLEPDDLSFRILAGRLIVEFTVPLAEPQTLELGGGVDVFDAEFYYAMEYAFPAIQTVGTPGECRATRRAQDNIDPVAVMLIRQLGLTADPAILNDPAAGFTVRVELACG